MGGLVGMVRECRVVTSRMEVDGRTEGGERHGRAFGVPAGTTESPGALPGRVAAARGNPQGHIERILLVGVVRPATALGGECECLVAGEPGAPVHVAAAEVDGPAPLVGRASDQELVDQPAMTPST